MICRTPGKRCKVCDAEIAVGAAMHRWYQGYRSPGFNRSAFPGYQHVDCRGK